MFIDNGVTALYLNGNQITYDAAFTAGANNGSLRIGSIGTDSGNLDGYMDNLNLIYSNYYNLSPNVGMTDTIANWNSKTTIVPKM